MASIRRRLGIEGGSWCSDRLGTHATSRPGRPIQSLERAAAIVRLLSGSRQLGVVQLAGELGLPKGAVHGLLRTLLLVGYVEQDSDTSKYQLGAALLHMGSLYLDGNKLRARALNWSDALAKRTQEAVRIGTLHDQQVLIVHHVFAPDDNFQALDVGSLLPAHATALGKVLLTRNPSALSEVIRLGLYTDATISDPKRLDQELRQIGELQAERVSIAAPITSTARLERSASPDHANGY